MNSFTRIDAYRDGCAQWVPWPDSEEQSATYRKLTEDLQSDRGALIDCAMTAGRINGGDSESWHREWLAAAESRQARARNAAPDDGLAVEAANWLRASNYFRAAAMFLQFGDSRRDSAIEKMRACSENYIALLQPCGEIVTVVRENGADMKGYFVRAGSASPIAPVVLCIGGWDDFKDAFLLKLSGLANRNGVSLLLVEPPATRGALLPRFGKFDVAISISACIDYLLTRDDVDPAGIAVYGLDAGAAFATEVATIDDRTSAAVCDGGAFILSQRAVAFRQMVDGSSAAGIEAVVDRLQRQSLQLGLLCPALVVTEYLDETGVGLGQASCASSLNVFSIDRNKASNATSIDASTSQRYVFEWIARTLRTAKSGRGTRSATVKARPQGVSQLSKIFLATSRASH